MELWGARELLSHSALMFEVGRLLSNSTLMFELGRLLSSSALMFEVGGAIVKFCFDV